MEPGHQLDRAQVAKGDKHLLRYIQPEVRVDYSL